MRYKTFFVTALILLSSSSAFAAQHFYTCSDWHVNGGGSGSCSGNTVTFTASDNYVTDGTYGGSTNSGFTITAGQTYYVTWNSTSGSYNQAHILQEYGGAQDNIQTYTFGTGTSTASFVAHSGTNIKLMLDNNGGGGAGTVKDVCISNTGFWECGYGSPPDTGTATTTTTVTGGLTYQENLLIIMIVIVLLSPIFWSFLFSPVKKT
jgi:hypothetical protein